MWAPVKFLHGPAVVPYPPPAPSPSAGLVTPSLLTGSQESDSSQSAKKDMLAALKSRQEALEETLRQRLEELKKLCLREAVSGYCCLCPCLSSRLYRRQYGD